MVSILLLSHGKLAVEYLNTLEMLIGEKYGITALGLEASEGIEDFTKRVKCACESMDNTDGILILTDLYGGTPSNSAIYAINGLDGKFQVLTGLNLPMLLEAALRRDMVIDELVYYLKKVGEEGIINVREVMKNAG